MKLQNLTVIFIIIIIPVILLQSAYISNGIKTINYQTRYDAGLISATHDAIYAYELNTINDTYSSNAQTKREILNASIKMFEKSLCKTCGISQFNTREIENYVPAIVFGMYDGFYLYAPSVIPKYKLQGYDSSDTECDLDDADLAYTMSNPTGEYKNEHNLKSYIYYSEQIGDNDDITIRYTLDNYVIVSGKLPLTAGGTSEYIIKSGYLISIDSNTEYDGSKYHGISIADTKAIQYYKEAYEFTTWFNTIAKLYDKRIKSTSTEKATYLNITTTNDPEDPNSAFVQHKRQIMKDKIETVLNSTITAYSARTWGNTFKMPKISPENWEKIYSDVSMITFFQGKRIGLTDYNGYCVLNSNNTSEYVNPNLLYFLDNGKNFYHDIRCPALGASTVTKGYNISRFHGKTVTGTSMVNTLNGYSFTYYWYYKDPYGNIKREEGTDIEPTNAWSHFSSYIYTRIFAFDNISGEFVKSIYVYPDNDKTQTYQRFKKSDNTDTEIDNDATTYIPLACYHCINASLNTDKTVYKYITGSGTEYATDPIKEIYWESLARERQNKPKLVEAR